MPFPCKPTEDDWKYPSTTPYILGETTDPVEIDWIRYCVRKLHRMRDFLRKAYYGLESELFGPYVDWILAAIIAREPCLLLGVPGVAKSEIVTLVFELLGLTRPKPNPAILAQKMPETMTWDWWEERAAQEKKQQKYFHYLLGRFTQEEHLFGPVDIALMKKGIYARVNFGFLTGPGVVATFLDEIFKASSSILNTLLTLCNERCYFNWGGMIQSDLAMILAASNEMPGIFSGGSGSISSTDEDFASLWAFVDRFPIRMRIPQASGSKSSDVEQDRQNQQNEQDRTEGLRGYGSESDLGKAFELGIERESRVFVKGERHRFKQPADMPCVNDLLLLGRGCLQDWMHPGHIIFEAGQFSKFKNVFLLSMSDLQRKGATDIGQGRITWSISPRKIKMIFKVALAHALVCDDKFVTGPRKHVELSDRSLHVMDMIWDSPMAIRDLEIQNKTNIKRFWKTK